MMNNNREKRGDPDDQLYRQHELDTNSRNAIYALRTTHQHQSQLLVLADQKANILVGILAVILTIIFTKADFLTNASVIYIIPIAVFIILEVAALLLALLVIMPKTIGHLHTTKIEDIPNPFYFGFFTMFSEDEYVEYLSNTLKDGMSARSLLAKDIYQTGFVLRRKYVLLKNTYILAFAGVLVLASSVVAFLFIR
jgi:hypothetical protein